VLGLEVLPADGGVPAAPPPLAWTPLLESRWAAGGAESGGLPCLPWGGVSVLREAGAGADGDGGAPAEASRRIVWPRGCDPRGPPASPPPSRRDRDEPEPTLPMAAAAAGSILATGWSSGCPAESTIMPSCTENPDPTSLVVAAGEGAEPEAAAEPMGAGGKGRVPEEPCRVRDAALLLWGEEPPAPPGAEAAAATEGDKEEEEEEDRLDLSAEPLCFPALPCRFGLIPPEPCTAPGSLSA
jgi:hypothetical protein